jgi:hypothetical protein
MWEASEPVAQLLALQGDSAVGWISIRSWQGKVFFQLQNI